MALIIFSHLWDWNVTEIWEHVFYLPNNFLNFADFLYRILSHGLFWKNWGLQSRKSLTPPISIPFCFKFGPFWVQHIFKACLWLGTWSEYSNCIHFLKALWNSFVMTLFLMGWRLPSKIDMGKSTVLLLSIPKWWKYENLM